MKLNSYKKFVAFVFFGAFVLLICVAVFQNLIPVDKEFEAAISSYKAVAEDGKKAASEAREFIEKSNQEFERIDLEYSAISYVADKYYELSQKEELTDEDLNLLEYYYNYLVSHGIDLK